MTTFKVLTRGCCRMCPSHSLLLLQLQQMDGLIRSGFKKHWKPVNRNKMPVLGEKSSCVEVAKVVKYSRRSAEFGGLKKKQNKTKKTTKSQELEGGMGDGAVRSGAGLFGR